MPATSASAAFISVDRLVFRILSSKAWSRLLKNWSVSAAPAAANIESPLLGFAMVPREYHCPGSVVESRWLGYYWKTGH